MSRNEMHWSVSVTRDGETIVTIESNCLSGRDLSPEDEDTIRLAAKHLLAFVGTKHPAEELRSWTLDNVFTIARREKKRVDSGWPLRPEMWAHVLRLCEAAGCQSRGVLRDNGGSVEEPPAADAVDPSAGNTGNTSTRV